MDNEPVHNLADRFLDWEPLPIRLYPDPVLRQPGESIALLDGEVETLAMRMARTMYVSQGVGLAAPQVAVSTRLILVDPWQDGRQPIVAINPILLSWSGFACGEEGCLSIPEFTAEVERAARIRVQYLDLEGVLHEEEYDDFTAVIFQHEIDHIDGILFPDRLSRLKRQVFLRSYGPERHPYRRPENLSDPRP